MKAWSELIHSPTEAEYHTRLEAFCINHPKACTEYCERTWLTPYKELLVSAWVDQHAHFGHTETSRVEGAHACLKTSIRVSTMDLYATYQRISAFWETQLELYDQAMEASKLRCPSRAQKPIFAQLLTRVYLWALNKIIQQYMLHRKYLLEPSPNPTCSGRFTRAWGLPCWHKIREVEATSGVLQLSEVHPHWLYKRENTIREYRNEVEGLLEPSIVKGKGRPKKGGPPDTSTRREKSHWGVADRGYSLEVWRPPEGP
jgi:hypothetical protein